MAGVAVWIIGVAAAVAGSLFAVSELAHGLLGQPVQQLVGAAVSVSADPSPIASPATAPSTDTDGDEITSRPHAAAPVTSPAPQSAAGTLLNSAYGSVMASCQPAGVYLLYWIPAQGFQADDVVRGPAAVARVTFEKLTSEATMTVSCASGTPIAHLAPG